MCFYKRNAGRTFATDATKLMAVPASSICIYRCGRYRKTRGSVITLISNIYTSFTTGPWPPVTRGPPTQLSALVTHCVHALLELDQFSISEISFGGAWLRIARRHRTILYPPWEGEIAKGGRWKWYSPYSRCRYLATSLPSSSLLLFISRFPREITSSGPASTAAFRSGIRTIRKTRHFIRRRWLWHSHLTEDHALSFPRTENRSMLCVYTATGD